MTEETVNYLMDNRKNWVNIVCKWKLLDYGEAEDVVAESLVLALETPLEQIEDLRAWFITVLYHQRRKAVLLRSRHPATSIDEYEGFSERRATVNTPEKELEALEIEEDVVRAIKQLPPKLHEVFVAELESPDEDQRVLAQQLGLSFNAFRLYLHRARALVGEKL